MCGIAGVACRYGARPDLAMLQAMSGALCHRGPDGQGGFETAHAALRHRRLSIVDLEGGAQPLALNDVVLVANGEIYNDLALRESLPSVTFRTGSDCEPPLALWPQLGMNYTDSLRGMYAIGMLDNTKASGNLVLSRDPFGIKPLYWAEYADGIAFASEPRALLAAGLGQREVRPEARASLLELQFTTGRETIYPGIKRVLPGETLRISNGRIIESRRRGAVSTARPQACDETTALKRLDRALLDSVSAHERADVPFGLFLSGGIDSSAILAAMAKLGCQRPLAWTARFDAGDADETEHAARLARHVGARHEVVTVNEEMVWRDLPKIIAAMDDPVADYAIIPTWFLGRAAKPHAKVILSGEGGDELFGGYGRYRRAMKPWWRGGRMPYRKSALAGLGFSCGQRWRQDFDHVTHAMREHSRLHTAQMLDVAEWLPNDLLLKLDRCLMAHGIEGRTPFLDPVVAEAAWNLPDTLKIRDGRGKYLLRRWLDDNMPEARAFAPKQGFTVPVGTWISARGETLGDLVARSPGIQSFAPADRVKKLFEKAAERRESRAAWHFLFYALWYRIHIEGIDHEGTVMEVLAAP